MFLKNYTSDVPVNQTIYRIEQVLLACGVTGIMKEYAPDGGVAAVTFRILMPDSDKPVHVRMPCNIEGATDALWANYIGTVKRPQKERDDFKEQGARTAWRIVKDWVEVQMSMIQMKQADVVQVFMSYITDGNKTYYEYLREKKFAGLLTR